MFKWLSEKACFYPFGEKVGFCRQIFKSKPISLRLLPLWEPAKWNKVQSCRFSLWQWIWGILQLQSQSTKTCSVSRTWNKLVDDIFQMAYDFRHRMKYEQSEQLACILRWAFKDIGRSVSASFSLHYRDGLLVFIFRHIIDNQLSMSEPLKWRVAQP